MRMSPERSIYLAKAKDERKIKKVKALEGLYQSKRSRSNYNSISACELKKPKETDFDPYSIKSFASFKSKENATPAN